jgi:hypothetical protein
LIHLLFFFFKIGKKATDGSVKLDFKFLSPNPLINSRTVFSQSTVDANYTKIRCARKFPVLQYLEMDELGHKYSILSTKNLFYSKEKKVPKEHDTYDRTQNGGTVRIIIK